MIGITNSSLLIQPMEIEADRHHDKGKRDNDCITITQAAQYDIVSFVMNTYCSESTLKTMC